LIIGEIAIEEPFIFIVENLKSSKWYETIRHSSLLQRVSLSAALSGQLATSDQQPR